VSPVEILSYVYLPVFEMVTFILTCVKTAHVYRDMRRLCVIQRKSVMYSVLRNGKFFSLQTTTCVQHWLLLLIRCRIFCVSCCCMVFMLPCICILRSPLSPQGGHPSRHFGFDFFAGSCLLQWWRQYKCMVLTKHFRKQLRMYLHGQTRTCSRQYHPTWMPKLTR
jgi:hypothetical protein